MTTPSLYLCIGMATSVFMVLGSCAPKEAELTTRLEDFDANVRIRAVLEATRTDRRDLMPELVERLDDEDTAVRLYAILALERWTGTRLGYSPGASGPQLRESVERWRRYLAENPSTLTAQGQTAGPASRTAEDGKGAGRGAMTGGEDAASDN